AVIVADARAQRDFLSRSVRLDGAAGRDADIVAGAERDIAAARLDRDARQDDDVIAVRGGRCFAHALGVITRNVYAAADGDATHHVTPDPAYAHVPLPRRAYSPHTTSPDRPADAGRQRRCVRSAFTRRYLDCSPVPARWRATAAPNPTVAGSARVRQ